MARQPPKTPDSKSTRRAVSPARDPPPANTPTPTANVASTPAKPPPKSFKVKAAAAAVAALLFAYFSPFALLPCTDCVDEVVMGGADLVAYFSLPKGSNAVMGKSEFAVSYIGYTFFFSSQSNKDQFEASPNDYLPAYGGFGAWALTSESEWSRELMGPGCDPHYGWAVVDGRLFCSGSSWQMSQFLASGSDAIEAADQRWRTWFGALTAGPLNKQCFPGMMGPCTAGTASFPHRPLGLIGSAESALTSVQLAVQTVYTATADYASSVFESAKSMLE